MLREKVIDIAFMKMMQHGCVVLDKSFFFFTNSSSIIDCQYTFPVSQSLNDFKDLKEKSYFIYSFSSFMLSLFF